MDSFEGLGIFIQRKRGELGLSQAQLADSIHLGRSHLGQIESAKIALPNPDIRRRLAAALGVTHLDLLVAAGEITPEEITKAGAIGVVEQLADDPTGQLLEQLRPIVQRDNGARRLLIAMVAGWESPSNAVTLAEVKMAERKIGIRDS